MTWNKVVVGAALVAAMVLSGLGMAAADEPVSALVEKPEAFTTLINPACSHCRDEARRRAEELKPGDRVLCWTRGYSDGGAIPLRFFLAPFRVISDSYGVFVYDPDAGFARGFSASYEFRFHGWRNGVMVMKHKDGTLYSCLSGVAFHGPKKGTRLRPIPTVVSDWGFWLEKYPHAVAYRMFDKYHPIDLPAKEDPDSVRSRVKPDPRLAAGESVLGVWTGKAARAYPIAALERDGLIEENVGGSQLVVLWEPKTRTASAYRPAASPPRKYKAPQPNAQGVSPPDDGIPIAASKTTVAPRALTLSLARQDARGRFQDKETRSLWDVAGRCVAGELQGWTLDWVDSVQVKWLAWAAEYPATTVRAAQPAPVDPNKKVKEVAGTAEFLRLLPKPFATLKAVDLKNRAVTLLIDGETVAKVWPVEPDAEVKVAGWWGRLNQLKVGERVWVWLKLNRKKHPASVVLLADGASEFEAHDSLRGRSADKARITAAEREAKRAEQKAWLRKRWTEDGLPGTLTIRHVFSGELEVLLDHEAMRWGRSLATGDVVRLTADPPIKAVVKAVSPWRERTVVQLVVGELESSELRTGQRLNVKMAPPAKGVDDDPYPPDLGRPRSKAERVEWFLASIYCTCGVSKDTCTGHFYTLSSCNPNGCAMPRHTRAKIVKMVDRGLSDRQIFDTLLKDHGPLLLRPHLMP